MSSDAIRKRINTLSDHGVLVTDYTLGIDSDNRPQIEFDHTSYPGIEAHLFTIADVSSWEPELLSSANVLLSSLSNDSDKFKTWMKLLTTLEDVMKSLEQYKQGLLHGIIPSSPWVYYEIQWYRKNWEGPQHELIPVESILHLIDESIKPHIKELNELGFQTTQSCSGLAKDHLDRDPYLPYVMFDERIYPRSSAHLFTLADISGWIPSYGPHNFDIELQLNSADGAERFWDKLVETARLLASLLQAYRSKFI
ncbi:MAG: hypothetical protein ACFFF9_01255 [Candidatus Thorarchaeota archaeon]